MTEKHSLSPLQKLDQQFHLHPFTNHAQMHEVGTRIFKSAKGCYLTDANGESFLDALAGLWCVNVGYGNQKLIDAIKTQLDELVYYPSFFNSTTEATIRLAECLAELAPQSMKHSIFSNSGSEANETALKVIRNYFQLKGTPEKQKVISRTFSYHGVSLGSGSLTGLPTCTDPFGLPVSGFLRVPGPYAYGAKKEADQEGYERWCLEQTKQRILEEGKETIAALFAEPIQGAGGVIIPSKKYLHELRALCKENDILFVSDEVITAFGRVDGWFLSESWNLDPDILCTAKGITSGYIPLGATIVSDTIADTLINGGYFAHGYTYSGHPVACATALANIAIMKEENLPGRVCDEIGPAFEAMLQSFVDHPSIGEVRVQGLIGALEVIPKSGRDSAEDSLALGASLSDIIRKKGVIVRGIRNLIALAPPLIVSHEEIEIIRDAIAQGLDELA